ncbi:hypothetical protein [Caudoviricetes sp.]|nr:hypothetical protein [Caudoviricetes sp.]
MANNQSVVGIFQDLGIDYSDMHSNPGDFARRVADAAKKLGTQLDQKNTLSDYVERFKYDAEHNTQAKEIADNFVARMEEEVYNFTPEVMVNILAQMPHLMQEMHGIVRATAQRKGNFFSRRRIHAMYVRIRKAYEAHVDFYKMFDAEAVKGVPIIPARSGNYSDDSSLGITEYVFFIGTTEYYNYYEAAKVLGIEIKNYMDIVEYFNTHESFEGKPLRLVELTR